MKNHHEECYAGFTKCEINRMVNLLKSNSSTVKRFIKSQGMQGMTTAAVMKLFRELRR